MTDSQADPGFHREVAANFVRQGRLDRAVLPFRRCVLLAPNIGAHTYRLATCLEKLSNMSGAARGTTQASARVAEWAVISQADDPGIEFLFTSTLTNSGRTSKAAERFADKVIPAGANPDQATLLTDKLVQTNRVAEAVAFLERIRPAGWSDMLERRYAVALWKLGRMAETVASFHRLSAAGPNEYHRLAYRGMAEACAGAYDDADETLRRAGDEVGPDINSNYRLSLAEMIRFSPSFHERIAQEEPDADLPEVRFHGREPGLHRACLVTVDWGYFKRFEPVFLVNARTALGFEYHLHVVNPEDEAELVAFARQADCVVSTETVPVDGLPDWQRRSTIAALRFPRALNFLATGLYRSMAIIDADSRLTDRTAEVFDLAGPGAFGMLHNPYLMPWFEYNASLTVIHDTSPGLAFLRHAARFATYMIHHDRPRWRLDQCALFSAMHYYRNILGTPPVFENMYAWRPGRIDFFKREMDEKIVSEARAKLSGTGLSNIVSPP